MSLTLTKLVWKASPTKGSTRLVGLCLADHVNEDRFKAGKPAEAFPSKAEIARLCNCTRDTVDAALDRLQREGRVEDTGKRKGRNVVVWRLFVPDLPKDSTGGEWSGDDLPNPSPDLPNSPDDLPNPPARPAQSFDTNQKEPVVEPEGTSPAGQGSPPSGLELQKSIRLVAERQEEQNELRRLLDQLPTTQHFDLTKRAVAELCDFLDPDGADMPFEVHATRAMVLA